MNRNTAVRKLAKLIEPYGLYIENGAHRKIVNNIG